MKKGKSRKNKKQMLVIWRSWKIIEILFKFGGIRRGIQGQIKKLVVNNQEITDQNKIHNELLFFYETLFRNTSANTSEDCKSFLNEVFVPKLNYEDARFCERDFNKLELLKALKSTQNNKSPENDGLTKEFYETFWNESKRKKEVKYFSMSSRN